MKVRHPVVVLLAVGLLFVAAVTNAQSPQEILDATATTGGLVVHVGCGDGRMTARFAAGDAILVHGIDVDAENIAQARRHVRSLGLYGKVSVDVFDGRRLPYTDNLVNLLVVEDIGDVPMGEVLRVLCPRGIARIKRDGKWTTVEKPWPAEIDEWTHFLHGADGNAVARDSVVGPPQHYQWIAGPLWMRSHESDSSVKALVTARGKLFYIVDDGPTSLLGDHDLPDRWSLAARDAFNGTLLWKVPIEDWGWQAWKPSWFTPRPGNIPLNIQKRLVAVGDKVYVTLGYRAPVSELDARSGRVLKTYAGTERTAEILYTGSDTDGRLVLTVLDEDRARVVAVDAESGKRLWTSENDYGGTTTDYYRFSAMRGSVTPAKVDPTLNTATDGRLVALLDGGDVVGLDATTGKQAWRTPFPLVEADYKAGNINARQTVWSGTLIVSDGVVLHASPNQLAAFSADSGETLWTQPKKYLQHLWFEWKDVFVIDGLVWTWSAELGRGKLEVKPGQRGGNSSWPLTANGYDLHGGELRKQVPLGNIFKTHHHHRCYRNKATSRYILASRRGTEFVDLEQGKHSVHNWIRGICHLGMMPANGLQYAPPHPCACYIDEKLNGFNALAAGRGEGRGVRDEGLGTRDEGNARLTRGPAYGQIPNPKSQILNPSVWPTFRGDPMRTGSVDTQLPATPKLLWRTALGGKVAPPIAVGNKVFVPLVDQHHLVALDVADGKLLWQFATGGRIDTPPTYHADTVIFGSADGSVYCVRADDGQLVWRFRAAPEDRRIAAFGQLESAWPVHGSVLILDGVAYFAAGRSSQLDGGIYLYGLDAATGRIRYQTRLHGPRYDDAASLAAGDPEKISQNYQLPMGCLADVLQGGDGQIYMRERVFNARLEPQKPGPPTARVYAKGGLLDGSYFKRMPWSFGRGGPFARLVVSDEQAAYSLRMFDSLQGLDPKVYFTPGKQGYLLFANDRQTGKQSWAGRIDVRVKAMVATDGVLLVAGPPDVVKASDPLAAFEGRAGGVLVAVDTATGERLSRQKLPAPPVFHGLAAAAGRLYVAAEDGSVACYGK